MNRFWTLAATPATPWPTDKTYVMAEAAIPTAGQNQALTRTIYVSLDPYQWFRQRDGRDAVGVPCHARTVSQVLVSHIDGIERGDFVFNTNGWAEYGLMGEGVPRPSYMIPRKLDPAQGRISYAVGVLGMLGLTAYVGMILECAPQTGETVVVSAASGGVGQIAGQLAKIRGCRVVGIAGREEKCRYVMDELGFDACVSHLSSTFANDLRSACDKGVDVYFESVGGVVFQAVLPLFNPGARMTINGLITHYGDAEPTAALAAEQHAAEAHGVRAQGFSAGDYVEGWLDAFLAEIAPQVASGQIRYREDIREGFEVIPSSFAAMLKGSAFGKTLVRLLPDPTAQAS
jgi:NADPH-dependent curcumin reductase